MLLIFGESPRTCMISAGVRLHTYRNHGSPKSLTVCMCIYICGRIRDFTQVYKFCTWLKDRLPTLRATWDTARMEVELKSSCCLLPPSPLNNLDLQRWVGPDCICGRRAGGGNKFQRGLLEKKMERILHRNESGKCWPTCFLLPLSTWSLSWILLYRVCARGVSSAPATSTYRL